MVRLSTLRTRKGRPRLPGFALARAVRSTGASAARASVAALAAALVGLVCAGPAFADIELEANGPVVHLHTDRLLPGDEQTFEDFIDQPRAEPIRIVYLDSRGGSTQAAIAIGRSIRQHGLATAFHVGQSRCVSACTTMFLGGVQRYYIDSAGVQDGVATRLGLGFHPSQGGARGEGMIEDYYRDMGVEGANTFRYAVYPHDSVMERVDGPNTHKLFFAGGNSALRAGVATSISEPADARLRD